jgi:Uma2 family endonuclease
MAGSARSWAISGRLGSSTEVARAAADRHIVAGASVMNVALRKPMSLVEFLAWEQRQEIRYEFDGLQAYAMVGGTAAHATVQRNLVTALTIRLRGNGCQPFGSELKIEVAGSIRYPDAFVVCTPVARNAQVIRDPVVIFEVLSPGTARVDRVTKNAEYRATASILRYVMLEQDSQAATVFAREGERWVGSLLTGDAVLSMPEIAVEVPLAELYEGLDLAESPGEASA